MINIEKNNFGITLLKAKLFKKKKIEFAIGFFTFLLIVLFAPNIIKVIQENGSIIFLKKSLFIQVYLPALVIILLAAVGCLYENGFGYVRPLTHRDILEYLGELLKNSKSQEEANFIKSQIRKVEINQLVIWSLFVLTK